MTPERRQEIRELLRQTMSQVGTPTMYIIALRKGLDDLLAACDALTAENATLRTRLDSLVQAAEGVVEEYTVEYTYYSVSAAKLIRLRDALASAVAEVKKGVVG